MWNSLGGKHNTKKNPVVVITGCSSGIGMAVAKEFISHPDFRVVLTTRPKSLGRLETQFKENEKVWILPLDVADEQSRVEFVNKVIDRWEGADIIINNAGICYRSVIEEMLDSDEHLQMETNYHGPISLIRHFLPHMRRQEWGRIINISSVSAKLAMPTMGSYSASKFALEGAMEALWYELKPFGIHVTQVEPGFVKSNSFERVKYSVRSALSMQLNKPYSFLYRSMKPFVEKMMKRGLASPENIAKKVYRLTLDAHPKAWIAATFDAVIFGVIKQILPKNLLLPFFYFFLPNSAKWIRNKLTIQKKEGAL